MIRRRDTSESQRIGFEPSSCVVTLASPKRQRLMGTRVPSRSVRHSRRPDSCPVGPASLSTSRSGPRPLADTMVTGPHGCWRDDAVLLVQSSVTRIVHLRRPPGTRTHHMDCLDWSLWSADDVGRLSLAWVRPSFYRIEVPGRLPSPDNGRPRDRIYSDVRRHCAP
jgi:hypothetical protein